MIFGVPKEALPNEHRVGLTPYGVSILTQLGQQVYVERDAGRDCHFSNEDYTEAGATIVYSPEEVYGRSDVVCRVSMLGADEVELITPSTTVCGFLHMAVMQRDVVEKLAAQRVTAVGYEIIEHRSGDRPILMALGELAGQLVVHTGASLLEYERGGRGVVLGACPGIPPATVVVLGAGTVGRTAARLAAACGAHVIVLDVDVARLREVQEHCRPSEVVTFLASKRNLAKTTRLADVLVGAINVPGSRAPHIVSEQMVSAMKPGSAILDLSIDEGGCVATSRPTTPDSPTFQVHGVTHYCVPNMTTSVPRAASRALTNSALPYLTRLAAEGIDAAVSSDSGLGRGVYMYRGTMVHRLAAEAIGIEWQPLDELAND